MHGRDPGEHHRVATPLELLFDLCFVVAVAQAAASLHHAIAHGHAAEGVVGFGLVFFAIWWAWMNFTWYASAYDTDDIAYRLKVLVQIVGVLVLAAGVPRAFAGRDYSIVTLGYVIMRVGLVLCWLRARSDPDPGRRRTATRYAVGIAIVQAGWFALALVPVEWWLAGWFVLMPAELAVPVWAERHAATRWHPHHIVERYGLLTLITIGESVLAATVAIQKAVDGGHLAADLIALIAGAIATLFAMWWIYFDHHPDVTRTSRTSFIWGYGHYFIFAALAATGAGIAAATDAITGEGHLALWIAGAAIAIPAAVYLLAVWLLIVLPVERGARTTLGFLGGTAAALAAIATPWPAAVVGATMVAVVAITRPLHHGERDH
ncbi:MAG: low temperature requirement protein A [Kofleriaceae bacterium]